MERKVLRIAEAGALILIGLLLVAGCSRFDAPTASQPQAETNLWNPQGGDQIIPGHEVPLLIPGYWGDAINPAALIPPRTVHIGPDGGVVQLGRHQLIVPAGAVDHDVTITMSNASNTGVGIDCSPSPFHFLAPVTLILSYGGTQYERMSNPPPLAIVYMAPDGSTQVLPSTMDVDARTVTSQTDHFSRYIIG